MTRSDQPAVDDIVERLQEKQYVCCGADYERDAYCKSCVLHAEASAEIKRLNNIITELKAHTQWLTQTAQERIHGGPQ